MDRWATTPMSTRLGQPVFPWYSRFLCHSEWLYVKCCIHYKNMLQLWQFQKPNQHENSIFKTIFKVMFYFTSEKRILNSIAFNLHIFQNTLYWSKILANKTYIVSCCNFRKWYIYILFINTHSRKCCRVKIIRWKLLYVHIADSMKIL